MTKRIYLVTGGAGSLGPHLSAAVRFDSVGSSAICLITFTGRHENIDELRSITWFELLEA